MLLSSVVLRAQLRPAPRAAAAPARAGAVSLRAAPRCVASAERLPPSTVRRVKLDGSAAGEATLALKTAKEATAVGLVHRYLVLVRQNARRVRARHRHPRRANPRSLTPLFAGHGEHADALGGSRRRQEAV